MRKIHFKLLLSSILLIGNYAYGDSVPEHTSSGTAYGNSGIDTYAKMRHGPDGALFLDPYILRFLSDVKGQKVLDAGCGAGPWSILAAKNGAQVWGIDIQEGMIGKAIEAAQVNQVGAAANFVTGDVGELPYPDAYFDRAFSINVGCNLPNLRTHIQELSRVLRKDGIVVITAPNAFAAIFTDGSNINIPQVTNLEQIQKVDAINRATFVEKEGIWELLTNESKLSAGDKIWRKIPQMVVPNNYHAEDEYLSLLNELGFYVVTVFKPKFNSEHDWATYNQTHDAKLGKEYIKHSPFIILVAKKK